jgi:ABC-2 type transport system ATP-binding protein
MELQLSGINKSFGAKHAVVDLDMKVSPGRIMGLIGQNGAGKSTTFRMILDFIQSDSGTITFDGQAIGTNTRQQIGFLPEERGLYQKMTVEDQILYLAELHGMKRADARMALQDWMKRLEVVGKMTDKVQTLSKGNAQKIQFIATFIHQPDLLILDEPFTGLDPVNTSLLSEEIVAAKKRGAGIIFSSHNMSGVEQLSDELLMLKNGRTVLSGDIATIRNSFGRTEVYLESDLSSDALQEIDGVLTIQKQGVGRLIKLSDESVGRTIFTRLAQEGYAQAFVQSPPTLDEIFRREVESDEE